MSYYDDWGAERPPDSLELYGLEIVYSPKVPIGCTRMDGPHGTLYLFLDETIIEAHNEKEWTVQLANGKFTTRKWVTGEDVV